MPLTPRRRESLLRLIAFDMALILGMLLIYMSIYVTFWFHESGHILYGFLNNLLFHGSISRFTVTNWVDFPPFPFLKAPQQVTITDGDPSLNFALGGILFVILAWAAISLAIFRTSRNVHRPWIFTVPIMFSLMEVLGNFFCGTDNLSGVPQSFCGTGPVQSLLGAIPLLLLIPFTILLYQPVRTRVSSFTDWLNEWKKRRRPSDLP
ncbi:MAG: hypothetical protein LUQ40_05385 [Methanomicrobiales archaeon]|nr:hypothetical protein [Methanomicrobiales archaeon]